MMFQEVIAGAGVASHAVKRLMCINAGDFLAQGKASPSGNGAASKDGTSTTSGGKDGGTCTFLPNTE